MKYSQKSFSVNAPNTDTYRDNWERTFRSGPVETDFPQVMELRHAADRAWNRGKKEYADALHREAAELFKKLSGR